MPVLFEIYCGLDSQSSHAKEIALDLALEYFPMGHSVREELGRWMGTGTKYSHGTALTEKTLVISWYAADESCINGLLDGQTEDRVNRMAARYKELAYQESVMVTKRDVEAYFV